MAKFSEEQKGIAQKLLGSPKTMEELSKEMKIPLGSLQDKLKDMMKLNLILKQDGFPTKYALLPEITEELKRRHEIESEDKNNFRIKAMIEMVALEPELLKKATDTITENLKKEPNFTVYGLKTQPVMKHGEDYSTFLDLNLSVKNFRSLIRFMYFYGPSSVEIVKPEKIELSAQDFQDGLMDMADMIQTYTQYIAKLMNRQEMENLHNQIISGSLAKLDK